MKHSELRTIQKTIESLKNTVTVFGGVGVIAEVADTKRIGLRFYIHKPEGPGETITADSFHGLKPDELHNRRIKVSTIPTFIHCID